MRAAAAEFAGTALLVGIGTGFVVAVATRDGAPTWAFALVWFVAVLIPVVLFRAVSGAHLNPAVTLGLIASGQSPVSDLPGYLIPQFGGAIAGSLAVEFLVGHSASLGANLPATPNLTLVVALEALFTGLLVASVVGLVSRSGGPGRIELALPPFVVGAATYVNQSLIGTCALNPARSLAPAVLSGEFRDLGVVIIADLVGALGAGLVFAPAARLAHRNLEKEKGKS